eukprot:4306925-Alexandrium_andersonii.AAC.1
MSASLVGSEMCIRDSSTEARWAPAEPSPPGSGAVGESAPTERLGVLLPGAQHRNICLRLLQITSARSLNC